MQKFQTGVLVMTPSVSEKKIQINCCHDKFYNFYAQVWF